jgi:ribosomal protein L40E
MRSTSSIDVRRAAYLGTTAAACLAVGVYARAIVGRFTTASLFLVIAAAVLCAAVLILFRAAAALVREPEGEEARVATGRRRKELEREKTHLLKALKELEFDHEMGKVSEEDFREIGGVYRARAVRVLRQLDSEGADYRALIERDVKARAGNANANANDNVNANGEAEQPVGAEQASQPSRGPTASATPNANVCARCSTKNDLDAEFCKKCGNRLTLAAKVVP